MMNIFVRIPLICLISVQLAYGQTNPDETSQPSPAELRTKVKGQLDATFAIAKTNQDRTDLVAAGTVVTLKRENLVMNKVRLKNNRPSSPVQNMYDKGEISQLGLLGVLSKINSFLGGSNPENISRAFEVGTKLWVTGISIEADGVLFRLMSDPIDNDRFHSILKFPVPEGGTIEQAAAKISDILTTDQPVVVVSSASQSAPQSPVDESEELRRASEAGDVNAMYRWANILAQRGENVDAVRWFGQASDKGHAKATNALGFMYDEGRGVPQNFSRASSLYLRAMKMGDADAMVNRGAMIMQGKGAPMDPQAAYMHFLLAAAYSKDNDTRNAAVKLKDDVAAKLSKQQIARGQAMADKFAKEEIR